MNNKFFRVYNKKIFVILPIVNGYEKFIVSVLKKNNNNVFCATDNLLNYYRIIKKIDKLSHKFAKFIIEYYYKFIVLFLPRDIDYVFILRGQHINNELIDLMKIHFKDECKYIIYQWDSSINNPNIINIYKRFDLVSTFDIEDSKKYHWKYRPLFYIDDYINDISRNIDILFLGIAHSERINVILNVLQIIKNTSIVFVSKLYIGFLAYIKNKYLTLKSNIVNLPCNTIIFKHINIKKVYELYNRTKTILDYTHPNQAGFTMRTIESIGCKCKLITNNKYIMLQDFYNPNNILVYDGVDFIIPDDFLKSPYVEIDQEVYNKYSVYNWLNDIFDV